MTEALPRFRLEGRTALITGGAGLLGREHAEALLETGAHLILADIDEAALARAADDLGARHGGQRIVTQRLDVTRPEDIANAVRQNGPVDILVNNAAIDPKVKPGASGLEQSRLEHLSLAQWNMEIAVGLTGAFLCAQIIGTQMAARGGGVILNIASDLSVIAPDQRLYRKEGVAPESQPVKPVTYSVIKTGLIGLTRYLAGYWAAQGVRCNALSPGGIYAGQPQDFVERLSALIPLGRMAARDEYRAAVQFLCSDASRYLTGQNIVMDGGRSIL